MIIAVTGGREVTPSPESLERLAEIYAETSATLVRVGDARGVDTAVREFCEARGIPHEVWFARWDALGRQRAGFARNEAMLRGTPMLGDELAADVDLTSSGPASLLVAWPGGNGTADCRRAAKSLGIRVTVPETPSPSPVVDVFASLPPIDVPALFGGRRVVCLDVETDARYSDLGVGRLVCMAYSFDGVHVQIVDAAAAVQLFRDWICDDELVLFGQSIYSDLAVLAQASYRTATGVDCVPGTEWAYELVHRAYERGRVVDTEIRTRLTCIRFGPHKSNPGLGPTVKYLFGVDIADAKSLTGNTKRAVLKLLADATPWSEWPRDIFDATPWRYKYGSLADVPLSQWPAQATEYVSDDVRWPWHVYAEQQRRWASIGRRAIPDEGRQTQASWDLHVLAIPGWLADAERAQRIRVIYRKVVAHVERTLVREGFVEVTPSVWRVEADAVRNAIVDVLGERAELPAARAQQIPEPTLEQRRQFASADAKAVKATLAVLGLKPVKLDSKIEARNAAAVEAFVASTPTPHPLQALGVWQAREALPEIVGESLARAASELAHDVLVRAGMIALTDEVRTTKKDRVAERVFAELGELTPLTKTGQALFRREPPTLPQRQEYASADRKAVRMAILECGGKALNVVDATDLADATPEAFDAWLAESKSAALNAYALHMLATKTISAFLDKLDTQNRVRTTYQTVIESGRVASRAVNVQQMPRDNGKPAHLHIRGCILPDPGWCFIVADYSQLELCSLAHALTELVRFYAADPIRKQHAQQLLGFPIGTDYESTLARAINSGKDCHLLMASTLLGKSYEYCVSLYTSAEHKKKLKQELTPDESAVVEARQLSKACNFGFPGGLGAKKFIDYAAAYGVTIGIEQAQSAKRSYEFAWPEMRLYFDYVGEKCAEAGPVGAVVKQLGSKRLRGHCNFTQYCNSFFQGLAADGAKEALASLNRACYRDPTSPLFGCRPSAFVHDEFLITAPMSIFDHTITRSEKEGPVPPALVETERLMVEAMGKWIPNVLIQAPGRIMRERWSK